MNRNTFARLAVLLLAVVSLALSGCGGDDGVDQSVHDMVTAERDSAAAALAAAQAAAEMAATEASNALAAAQQAQADAINAQTAAEAARDEARMGEEGAEMRATAAEDAAAMALAAAQEAAMLAQQAADDLMQAEATVADLTMRLEAVEMERDDVQGDLDAAAYAAMAAEMRARAATLITALNVIESHEGEDNTVPAPETPDFSNLADPDDPQTGQPEDDVYPGQPDNYMDAPDQRGGLGFANTMGGGVAIDMINDAPVEFQEYDVSESMAPAIDGWDSVVLERRNDGDNASQILYAYTDIATAGTTTFLEKYAGDLNMGMLTVSDLTLAASPSFPGRSDAIEQFAAGTDADAVTFAGTYDGVAGLFRCGDTGACMVNADDGTGALTTDNPFIFTPNDASDTIGAPDGGYLYFGYWLHKPDSSGGMHGFALVYGGNDMFDVDEPTPGTPATIRSAVLSLAGEARFSGPAAGKYVTRDLNENTANIGVFTATAELLASFGDETVYGTVDGVIRDFEGGAPMNNNWRVTLGDASLNNIGLDEANLETAGNEHLGGRTELGHSRSQFTGPASARLGGAVAGAGDWVGTFYGNDRGDGAPESVAGAFEVMAPHAGIAGTFGAYNDE